MKKIILFVLLFPSIYLKAQSFYVVSQRDVPLISKTFILNTNSCDSILAYTCLPSNNILQVPENQYTDMAVNNQYIYYTSAWGSLYRKNLGDTTSCQYLGSFNNLTINALIVDSNNVVYATGQQNGICYLVKYHTGIFTNLGNLPTGFFSAGDLFFYNDRLFMTGTDSNLTSGYIYEINISNPSASCLYMNLPGMQAWGAFSIDNGSGTDVYVTDVQGSTSLLVKINMQNLTISPVICSYPFAINGAGTYYKLSGGISNCNITSALNYQNNNSYFFTASCLADQLKINTTIDPARIKIISIIDIGGKEIKHLKISDKEALIKVHDISEGIYILRLTTVEGEIYNQRFIKTITN